MEALKALFWDRVRWVIDYLEGHMEIEEAQQFLDLVHSCLDPSLSADYIFLLRHYADGLLSPHRVREIESVIRDKKICPSTELLILAVCPEVAPQWHRVLEDREDVKRYVQRHAAQCEECIQRLERMAAATGNKKCSAVKA